MGELGRPADESAFLSSFVFYQVILGVTGRADPCLALAKNAVLNHLSTVLTGVLFLSLPEGIVLTILLTKIIALTNSSIAQSTLSAKAFF